MLNDLNLNLDVIAVTESPIKENLVCLINIQLQNYSFEHTPTEATTGGTLLYISNRLSYKPRTDLKMFTSGKLESVLTEIICLKTTNLIICCIYKHPMHHFEEFNSNYIFFYYTNFQKIPSKIIFIE